MVDFQRRATPQPWRLHGCHSNLGGQHIRSAAMLCQVNGAQVTTFNCQLISPGRCLCRPRGTSRTGINFCATGSHRSSSRSAAPRLLNSGKLSHKLLSHRPARLRISARFLVTMRRQVACRMFRSHEVIVQPRITLCKSIVSPVTSRPVKTWASLLHLGRTRGISQTQTTLAVLQE